MWNRDLENFQQQKCILQTLLCVGTWWVMVGEGLEEKWAAEETPQCQVPWWRELESDTPLFAKPFPWFSGGQFTWDSESEWTSHIRVCFLKLWLASGSLYPGEWPAVNRSLGSPQTAPGNPQGSLPVPAFFYFVCSTENPSSRTGAFHRVRYPGFHTNCSSPAGCLVEGADCQQAPVLHSQGSQCSFGIRSAASRNPLCLGGNGALHD